MHEWWKRLLGITEPVFDDTPTPAEQQLAEAEQQTEWALLRGQVQLVRSSKAVSSWEDLYGRREES